MTGCGIGAFGKGCSNKCSGHCLHNFTCNSTSGHCDSGCASGYEEPFCNKSVCVIIASDKWILIQLESRVLGNLLKQIYIFDKRFNALKIKCVNNAYTFRNTTKATTCRVQNNSTLYLS